jgi:mannose/fructose/N-acetylgalactosamine-specific phosphotransferase system component IIC
LNTKAQIRLGIVAFVILLAIGIFFYAQMSDYITSRADEALDSINMSPTERFFLSNIHVWVIVIILIAVLAFGAGFYYMAGGGQ